jgi:hypothetical protein
VYRIRRRDQKNTIRASREREPHSIRRGGWLDPLRKRGLGPFGNGTKRYIRRELRALSPFVLTRLQHARHVRVGNRDLSDGIPRTGQSKCPNHSLRSEGPKLIHEFLHVQESLHGRLVEHQNIDPIDP